MHFKVLGILVLASTALGTLLQYDLQEDTGRLVKAFIRTNALLSDLVKEELSTAHEYMHLALLNRLKEAESSTELNEVKPKLKEEFLTVVTIDKECIETGGLTWFANRALRNAEMYRELYRRSDPMQICFMNSNPVINKPCASVLARYKGEVETVKEDLIHTMSRMNEIYDETIGCLRFRYGNLFKRIDELEF